MPPELDTPESPPEPSPRESTGASADDPRLPRRRRPGLAWWMIALGGLRRFRAGGPNVTGGPEDVPWLLILRATRTRVLPGLFAWPMVLGSACATFGAGVHCASGTRDLGTGELMQFVWSIVFFLPLLALAFGNAAVVSATGLPRWLRRHHAAEDFLLLPVPGPAWAAAQARLFVVAAAWGVAAFVVPFLPVQADADIRMSAEMPFVFGLVISIAVGLNWVLYWARILGGWVRWMATVLLWAFYPVVFFGRAASRHRAIFAALEGYPFHFAFLALCVAVGLAGMRRSAREYPDILRRKLFK